VLCLGQTEVNQCCVIKHASVSRVLEIRDLGILIDNKLTMSQHICTVVKKSQTRASLIVKCFHSRHRATLLKAFITYVRPLLEYATPVWTPYSVKDVTKIESVQQSFTNRLPGLSNLPYTKHLLSSWCRQFRDMLVVLRFGFCIQNVIWNRAGHYILMLWFLSSYLFFPRLISAVGDWMSTILRHVALVRI